MISTLKIFSVAALWYIKSSSLPKFYFRSNIVKYSIGRVLGNIDIFYVNFGFYSIHHESTHIFL